MKETPAFTPTPGRERGLARAKARAAALSPTLWECHTTRGFTLIELAIVLVIIGLIVGGVLVGRDLIKASEARAQISQIQQYNAAINTFRDKYGGLPGDLYYTSATQFGFYVPAGSAPGQQGCRDGNGLIDGAGATGTLAAIMGENLLFWTDLSTANLIDGSFADHTNCNSSATYTTAQIPSVLPSARIGYANFIHVYEISGFNWFMLAEVTSANIVGGGSRIGASANLPVNMAYNIDQKIDDGIPNTGRVQAVYINGSQTATIAAPNSASDSAATCYNTATTPAGYSIGYNNGNGANCALSFRCQ